jgi:hypothetical protein
MHIHIFIHTNNTHTHTWQVNGKSAHTAKEASKLILGIYTCIHIHNIHRSVYVYTHNIHMWQVNGKSAHTAEEASKLILGNEGSQIAMNFERTVGGRPVKFTVKLIRGKPKT